MRIQEKTLNPDPDADSGDNLIRINPDPDSVSTALNKVENNAFLSIVVFFQLLNFVPRIRIHIPGSDRTGFWLNKTWPHFSGSLAAAETCPVVAATTAGSW